MRLIALRTEIIHPRRDLLEEVFKSMEEAQLKFSDGDILALSSKVVATAQGRIAKLKDFTPSKEAAKLADMYSLDKNFVEIVLREADEVFGGVYGAILTLKDGLLVANAGVDQKNAPPGYVVLMPQNPSDFSDKMRVGIYERTGRRVAVIIVDSRVTPLRLGTVGYALGASGFKLVIDLRFKTDLYGRKVRITRHSIADDLSSAAHAFMGETDERVFAVLIRDAPIELTEENSSCSMKMPPEKCLFMSVLLRCLDKENRV